MKDPICRQCSKPILSRETHCAHCKTVVPPEHSKECPVCGKAVEREANTCIHCGGDFEKVLPRRPSSSLMCCIPRRPTVPTPLDVNGNMMIDADYVLIKERCDIIVKEFLQEADSIDHADDEQSSLLRSKIRSTVNSDPSSLHMMDRAILLQFVLDEVFGFGPLGPLKRDASVNAIFVYEPNKIQVLRKNGFETPTIEFKNQQHLRFICIHKACRSSSLKVVQGWVYSRGPALQVSRSLKILLERHASTNSL